TALCEFDVALEVQIPEAGLVRGNSGEGLRLGGNFRPLVAVGAEWGQITGAALLEPPIAGFSLFIP
ncbi:MAG: hypothetical protein ABSB68_18180, partial [Acidimicrobiales bacterium]